MTTSECDRLLGADVGSACEHLASGELGIVDSAGINAISVENELADMYSRFVPLPRAQGVVRDFLHVLTKRCVCAQKQVLKQTWFASS